MQWKIIIWVTTCRAGLFTGTFVSLFIVYAILAHLSGMYSAATEASYIETVYPIFRFFPVLLFQMQEIFVFSLCDQH